MMTEEAALLLAGGVSDPPLVPSGANCFVCLEGERIDKNGSQEPLLRNCACKGDSAGYAHTSCIIKYAQAKLNEAFNSNTGVTKKCHSALKAWTHCPSCTRGYQGELAIILGKEFVARTAIPPQPMKFVAIALRLNALHFLASRHISTNQYDAALSLTHQLLEFAKKNEVRQWFHVAYFITGRAFEGKKDLHNALMWYEKASDMIEFNDDVVPSQPMIDTINRSLSRVRSLEIDLFRQRVVDADNHHAAFKRKIDLAIALASGDQHSEALKLCKEAIDYFESLSGPDHPDTVRAHETLSRCERLCRARLKLVKMEAKMAGIQPVIAKLKAGIEKTDAEVVELQKSMHILSFRQSLGVFVSLFCVLLQAYYWVPSNK